MSPEACLGPSQISMTKPFLQNFSKCEQIGRKIHKKFRQIYLKFIIYCSHKGFYDRTFFYFVNTDSSCFF